MLTYKYKARDKSGQLIQGLLGADSENAVALKLEQMGYLPIAIVLVGKEPVFVDLFDRFRTVKFTDINLFTRQLYTLQKAGLSLIVSLNAIREQAVNKKFQAVITHVVKDIETGISLSQALERHPKIFNALFTSMVKSGEASGKLVEVLGRLATLGEFEEKTRMRIKAATRYPLIVIVAMILGFTILTIFVIPRFANLYAQFSAELPLPTQILIGTNYVVTHFWWLLLIVFFVSGFLLKRYIETSAGRWMWDYMTLKLPVFGELMQKMVMSRFCRITAILMRSGVPILQILDLVSNSIGNVVIAKTIKDIKGSINEGKGMLAPMKSSGLFPPIVIQMVSAGEQTGKVDELLEHAAEYYDMQIDYMISNLVSLIEPLLIFVLGCGVLFMALGIFMPMWNMMNLFIK